MRSVESLKQRRKPSRFEQFRRSRSPRSKIASLSRFVIEEAKKQYNIEAITEKALPLLGEGASPQNIEDDWIAHFFDRCRLISDEEMQGL
ncbi:MAG: DUF2806 domain-containing protein, partial [Steroidobacteraceae bacterium]